AVVKDDILTQVEGECFVVVAPQPFGRELRHEIQLRVDVDQLVAERGEDNAANEGARPMRVEHVRIFLEADAELLGRSRRNRQDSTGKQSRYSYSHASSPYYRLCEKRRRRLPFGRVPH